MSEYYTYHAGLRIRLEKSDKLLLARTEPARVEAFKFHVEERRSAATLAVEVPPGSVETAMERFHNDGLPAYPYYLAGGTVPLPASSRVFVRFHKAPTEDELTGLWERHQLRQVRQYSDVDYLAELTGVAGDPVVAVCDLVEKERSLVALAEHDFHHKVAPTHLQIPDDDAFLSQWHLQPNFENSSIFDRRSCTECDAAWKELDGFGDSHVIIGLTDDGCLMDHPAFATPGKFPYWGYFSNDNGLVEVTAQDDPATRKKTRAIMGFGTVEHGTACAGAMAAGVHGGNTVGVAPACRLAPIRWKRSEDGLLLIGSSRYLDVLQFLGDKVDIICNPWAESPISAWGTFVTDRIKALTTHGGRRGKGIVFIWAAGNSNCPLHYNSFQEIPYTDGRNALGGWTGVHTSKLFLNDLIKPGLDNVVHVAAISSLARRSHYSNYGPGVKLCAPSDNAHLYGALDVEGGPLTALSANRTRFNTLLGGTSGAAAIVAGIAALVISANKDLTARQVVQVLQQTADKDLDPTPYPRGNAMFTAGSNAFDVSPVAPWDRGQFSDIGHPDGTWSPWFGFGKVNALKAVTKARMTTPEEVKPAAAASRQSQAQAQAPAPQTPNANPPHPQH